MFKSYVTSALRGLIRDRGYGVTNVVGLAIGVAAFLLIATYIRHELAYDRHHTKIDRVYRIVSETRDASGDVRFHVGSPGGMAQALKEKIPGVEEAARYWWMSQIYVGQGDQGFYHRFDEVKLVQPFEKHLKKKQRRMDAALEAFDRLVDYEVAEVTAAATFYMAEVYSGFSQALMESERPAGLGPTELQDYEMVLEEEAFPFEERAIDVHEKNLELMAAGIFNPWIEKSIGRLADLMPGRYAKFEASSGLIASIDTYVYRAPRHGSAEGG